MLLRNIRFVFVAVWCVASVAWGSPRNPDNPPLGGASTYDPTGEAVWIQPWGVAGTWWPNQVFHEDMVMPGNQWNESRQEADKVVASGRNAMLGAVAWIDTFQEGLPKGPAGEGGNALDLPAWVKFSQWHKQRDELISRDAYGSYWWYRLGWISPATPLDEADWAAAAMPHATYGDFIAERIGSLCEAQHYTGFYGADLIVNMPNAYISGADFHPRNLEAFELRLGWPIPGDTAAQKARYIRAHLMPEWADYWCDAYGHFFASIGEKIRTRLGKEPLIGGQIYGDITLTRWLGGDMRRYLQLMPPENWYFDLEMQGDPLRSVRAPSYYAAAVGTACAWEPSMLLGSKMDVFDDSLRGSLELAGLPLATGNAVQHTHWFQIVFTHIATREGGIRRAVTALQYGYGMTQIANVDPRITQVMRDHIPRRPFGPAFYYSEAMVRSFEREDTCWKLSNLASNALEHVGCGFYVTDAALGAFSSVNKPACWIVLSPERLPAVERARLEQFAPVVTPEQAGQLTPTRTSANGMAWGFIDQEGRLVVLVTNLARGESAVRLDLSGLADGTFAPTDALTGETVAQVTASGGAAQMIVNLADYDTRVLVFPAAAVPNL
ncbi:MAG TPA: hypothetical protein PKY36_04875 [Opitutaceae bacterium]|nr:hypothetical protein [Opitutaceae bacterium]